MSLSTLKTSTIVVATGKRVRTFRTREEMPEPLRQRMEQALGGNMAATVLIADPRGRDEILKTLRGEASALNDGVPGLTRRRPADSPPIVAEEPPPARWYQTRAFRLLVAIGVPLLCGVGFYTLLRFPQ